MTLYLREEVRTWQRGVRSRAKSTRDNDGEAQRQVQKVDDKTRTLVALLSLRDTTTCWSSQARKGYLVLPGVHGREYLGTRERGKDAIQSSSTPTLYLIRDDRPLGTEYLRLRSQPAPERQAAYIRQCTVHGGSSTAPVKVERKRQRRCVWPTVWSTLRGPPQ